MPNTIHYNLPILEHHMQEKLQKQREDQLSNCKIPFNQLWVTELSLAQEACRTFGILTQTETLVDCQRDNQKFLDQYNLSYEKLGNLLDKVRKHYKYDGTAIEKPTSDEVALMRSVVTPTQEGRRCTALGRKKIFKSKLTVICMTFNMGSKCPFDVVPRMHDEQETNEWIIINGDKHFYFTDLHAHMLLQHKFCGSTKQFDLAKFLKVFNITAREYVDYGTRTIETKEWRDAKEGDVAKIKSDNLTVVDRNINDNYDAVLLSDKTLLLRVKQTVGSLELFGCPVCLPSDYLNRCLHYGGDTLRVKLTSDELNEDWMSRK